MLSSCCLVSSSLISLLPHLTPPQEDSSGRQVTMVPLVIPVSVPVHRNQADPQAGWSLGHPGPAKRPAAQSDHKPSVIVDRRRPLRNSITESFGQVSTERLVHLGSQGDWTNSGCK